MKADKLAKVLRGGYCKKYGLHRMLHLRVIADPKNYFFHVDDIGTAIGSISVFGNERRSYNIFVPGFYARHDRG